MWWVSYRPLGVEVAIGVTPKYPVFIPLLVFPTTSIISSASDFMIKGETRNRFESYKKTKIIYLSQYW